MASLYAWDERLSGDGSRGGGIVDLHESIRVLDEALHEGPDEKKVEGLVASLREINKQISGSPALTHLSAFPPLPSTSHLPEIFGIGSLRIPLPHTLLLPRVAAGNLK